MTIGKNKVKSIFNVKDVGILAEKNIEFYHRHCTSYIAYLELFKKYFRFIGGFFKWKILNLLSKKRKQ